MHVNTMNVYLIVATTYECKSPEGERFAMFAAGRTMREAFGAFAREWASQAFEHKYQQRASALALSSFLIAALHAPDVHDTLRFVDDDGGACTFTIVRVAAEGGRDQFVHDALAHSLAQAFDA